MDGRVLCAVGIMCGAGGFSKFYEQNGKQCRKRWLAAAVRCAGVLLDDFCYGAAVRRRSVSVL